MSGKIPESGEDIPDGAVGLTVNSVHEAGKQFVFSIARMLDLNKDSKDSKESKQPQSKGKRAAGKKIELEVVLEDLEHTLISWPTAWLVRNAVIKKKVLLASSLKPLSSSSSSSGASSSSKSRA